MTEFDFSDRTLMVAEDEEISLYYLSELLKDKFKRMISATNGKEVLELLEENEDVDLILMDIRMPIIDGLEATRKIRETNKDVAIIAQTAYAMKNDREEALASGCNECVTKPINEEELFQKIKEILK